MCQEHESIYGHKHSVKAKVSSVVQTQSHVGIAAGDEDKRGGLPVMACTARKDGSTFSLRHTHAEKQSMTAGKKGNMMTEEVSFVFTYIQVEENQSK